MHRLLGLFLFASCATAEPNDPCAQATDILVDCGFSVDQSPFGTCEPAQRAHAEELIALHAADGCTALTNAKADGIACSVVPFLCVEHSLAELAPFTTDGCSMFPDGTLSNPTRWQRCCIEHDFAYYAGGPSKLREAADLELRACISAATNAAVGDMVYFGVRLGGTPALPTPWRWGYGWQYDPLDGFRELPPAHSAAAAAQIAAYQASPVPPMAFEQRMLALANVIASVPGMLDTIAKLGVLIAELD